MKFLKTFVRNFVINIDFSPHKTPILGRWAHHHDKNADLKDDLTNEDHCGVCDKMRYDYLKKIKH